MRKPDRELIEKIERDAWTDLCAAAREQDLDGVRAEARGDVLLLHDPASESPLTNRVLGLGLRAGLTRDELDAVLDRYRRAGTSRFFVHLYDDALPPELPDWLESRGVVRYRRSWNKLARGRAGALPGVSTRLWVRPALSADAAALGAIFAAGFDLNPAAGRAHAAVIGRKDWHVQVATDGERVVSAGLLFIADGVGYLAGGATAPDARGQGAQLSLLVERCRIALECGCEWIVSETGAAVPGDPQHSHRNLERCGLLVMATRHNYAPHGTLWQHGWRA